MDLKLESTNKCFNGTQNVYSHQSDVLGCTMRFGVFIPEGAESAKVPVLYYLSGLTCTEQNFVTKANSQQYASKYNILVVAPDTSPRGCNIPGEDDSYDFGSGAGFYVDATEEKWKKNYRMYSYITIELPAVITKNFNVKPDCMSIMGHSMGGHGALICAFKNPGLYKSVSAFAPICNPMNCPWGQKAFTGYLGPNTEDWKQYDACELVKSYDGPPLSVLVDQGTDDQFLRQDQLLPTNLMKASIENKMQMVLRMQDGYDHSYYFMATFMGEHFEHHNKFLQL